MGRMTEAERAQYAQEQEAEDACSGPLWWLHGRPILGGFLLGIVTVTALVTLLHYFLAVPL
jgi:hypothetical protein